MKRLFASISAVALAIVVGVTLFPADGAHAQQKRRFITIGTGGPTGVYFVVGNAICRMANKEAAEGRKSGRKHGSRCSAPSTAGSVYNIDRKSVV